MKASTAAPKSVRSTAAATVEKPAVTKKQSLPKLPPKTKDTLNLADGSIAPKAAASKPAAKTASKPAADAAAPAGAAAAGPTMADLVREAARAHRAEGGTSKPAAKVAKPAAKAAEPVKAAEPAPKPADVKPAETRPPENKMGGPIQHGGRPPQISRASNKDESFAENDYVVYPTHGVGKVEKIAVEDIAGHRLELIHITFEENRMTLRVPVAKARSAGLRKLATRKLMDDALAVLKGRARIKRTMWSRRAQEYEAKINSGDPLSIAEVVRDLHRNSGQPDQSFSERQIYEAALDRLAAELGALEQIDKLSAIIKLTQYLKSL